MKSLCRDYSIHIHRQGLCLRQVIIEVEVDGLHEGIIVHAQFIEILIVVMDTIFLQGLVHFQVAFVVLPGVAACVAVVLHVAIQNLKHVLL